jgi:hypothetical protein
MGWARSSIWISFGMAGSIATQLRQAVNYNAVVLVWQLLKTGY